MDFFYWFKFKWGKYEENKLRLKTTKNKDRGMSKLIYCVTDFSFKICNMCVYSMFHKVAKF
jgi:hypothetical protein